MPHGVDYPKGSHPVAPGQDALAVLEEIKQELGGEPSAHVATLLCYEMDGETWAQLTFYKGPGSGRQPRDPAKTRTPHWVTMEGSGKTTADALRAAWEGQPEDAQ